MDYEKQAKDFMEKHLVEISLRKFAIVDNDEMFGDRLRRAKYQVKMARQKKDGKKETYEFEFTDSAANTEKLPHHSIDNGFNWVGEYKYQPTAYSILACLQKTEPGSLEEFCSDCGFNPDSIKDNKVYAAVCKEYNGLSKLFTQEELDEMAEIQ